MVLTCAKYVEKRNIKSVDKSRLYIMFNGLPFKRKAALPRKVIIRKELLSTMVSKTNDEKVS